MKIIDTHIHLDMPHYSSIFDDVLTRAANANVDKIIIPGLRSDNMDKIIALCDRYDQLYFSTGHHPDFRNLDSFNKDLTESFVSHPKCVAIGECGIDFYRAPDTGKDKIIEQQKLVFQAQIDLALKYDKPMIIHSRDAADVVVDMLKPHIPKLRGVIHCFVGDEKLLELSESFYFGIGGVLTYRSATEFRENIKKVPIDRMILETDGPFLTPRKYGKQTNESSFIPEIVKEISSLTSLPEAVLLEKCFLNSNLLFKF
jgi:TatD DNase family protein